MEYLRQSKGFTLIELLIALIILSISLLALAGLMVVATQNNSFGGHITEAVTFAQDKLEEFRANRWENITPLSIGTDQTIGCTGIDYTRTWTIVQNGNLKTIEITINWNDRVNHSISLSSVLSQ
jgi:prepilin-type N-terminal cleavage/methylation domain-containing protein